MSKVHVVVEAGPNAALIRLSIPSHAALALGVAVWVARRGYRKRSLNLSGALSALAVGTIACFASIRFGMILIIFFLGSSKVTKVGAKQKAKLEDGHKTGGERNWVQVLANGGMGTMIAAYFVYLTRAEHAHCEMRLDYVKYPKMTMLQLAYMCHYACTNADTWASELGILAKKKPRLVTSPWREVPPGTNGGVSVPGLTASVFGGLIIGAAFYCLGELINMGDTGSAAPSQWPLVPMGMAAGLGGSLIDSLLGATLQYSGYCSQKQLVVNTPGPGVKRICGLHLLDNHQVNFLSAGLTAAMGACAAPILFSRLASRSL